MNYNKKKDCFCVDENCPKTTMAIKIESNTNRMTIAKKRYDKDVLNITKNFDENMLVDELIQI